MRGTPYARYPYDMGESGHSNPARVITGICVTTRRREDAGVRPLCLADVPLA